MIWVFIALVAAVALAPFGWTIWRGGQLRSRREAAMALHRAQLLELDRDLSQGRLLESEHAAARLEVQRRLLAEAELTEAGTAKPGSTAVILTAVLVPVLALFLYVADGMPNYRAVAATAQAEAAKQADKSNEMRDAELVMRLQAILSTMDPADERTRKGYVMLGNAELKVGQLPDAVTAWQKALASRFEPTLGAETAELIADIAGHVTPESAALFKRALAAAPADAPWRKAAEKRLAEAGGS
jgi:cytochrome c-type biogenesis protein CcmH